jgi:hypothetical protein
VSCVSVRRRGAGAASGKGVSLRCRRRLRSRGCGSGSVSVACSGTLDSGRIVKTFSGSPGSPGRAGSVIARLGLGDAAGAGAVAGRVAW